MTSPFRPLVCMMLLGLAACADTTAVPPPETPAVAPVDTAPERAENVCPLIRFLVDGQPAEAQGYDVVTAITAVRQRLRAEGMEMVVVDRMLDRFQTKTINTRAPLYSDSTQQVSSAAVNDDVRGSIRRALNEVLIEYGNAELANCEWVLTGQVHVAAARPDPMSPFFDTVARADLMVVDVFADRSIADGVNPPGPVRGASPEEAEMKAMAYAIEGAVATMGPQLRDARNLYVVYLLSDETNLVNRQVIKALEANGFVIRSQNDTAEGRKLDSFFAGSAIEAEDAVAEALIALGATPPFSGMDYRIKGKVLYLMMPGKCPPSTIDDCIATS